MWDGHLCQTKAAQHQIDMKSAAERPIDLASYQAGSRAREFGKHEIDKMLVIDVI